MGANLSTKAAHIWAAHFKQAKQFQEKFELSNVTVGQNDFSVQLAAEYRRAVVEAGHQLTRRGVAQRELCRAADIDDLPERIADVDAPSVDQILESCLEA